MEKIPDYMIDIEREVLNCADEFGIEHQKALQLAKKITKSLSFQWGGLSIYFLKGISKREELREKHAQIIDEFNGTNIRELAKKYGFSEMWIYNLVREKIESMNGDIFT